MYLVYVQITKKFLCFQCHNLAEVHESLIEEWWFKHQKNSPDLHEWLCIQKLRVCCPDHHYGPDCKPCPGFPDEECNGNGKCKVKKYIAKIFVPI